MARRYKPLPAGAIVWLRIWGCTARVIMMMARAWCEAAGADAHTDYQYAARRYQGAAGHRYGGGGAPGCSCTGQLRGGAPADGLWRLQATMDERAAALHAARAIGQQIRPDSGTYSGM